MRAANLKWFDVMKLNVPRYGQLLLAIIHHGWLRAAAVEEEAAVEGEEEAGEEAAQVGSNRIASHWIALDRFGYAMLARHAASAYSVLFLWPQLFHYSPIPFSISPPSLSLSLTPCFALSKKSIKPNSVKR